MVYVQANSAKREQWLCNSFNNSHPLASFESAPSGMRPRDLRILVSGHGGISPALGGCASAELRRHHRLVLQLLLLLAGTLASSLESLERLLDVKRDGA